MPQKEDGFMKKILVAVVLLVFLASVAGCGTKQTQTTPGNASENQSGSSSSNASNTAPSCIRTKLIHVTSDPEGATVNIDGSLLSLVTPIDVELLPGHYTFAFGKMKHEGCTLNVNVKEDTEEVKATLKASETRDIPFYVSGPIVFGSVPYKTCCSAAEIAYSNIFYGGTYTIGGATYGIDSFDIVFPSGRKVHFDTEKVSDKLREFSKAVTFDEVGFYKVVANGEVLEGSSFSVDYKATILPGTPVLDLFPDFDICKPKKTIAVPVGGKVEAKLLITDAKGNPIRNTPLGGYDLKTDSNGIVTFEVSMNNNKEIFVNGKPAQLLLYADILAWGYDYARFSKEGKLINASFPGASSTTVKFENGDVYMPLGSFGFGSNEMYDAEMLNLILPTSKDPSVIYTNRYVSRDEGAHWTKLEANFKIVTPDPNKPNVLYGVAEEKYSYAFLKSEDYGMHFTEIKNIKIDADSINQIVIDPNDSNTIYLAMSKGIFKTNNGGKTWIYILGPFNKNVKFIAVNPKDSNVIFVSSSNGLFRTNDRGKTWVNQDFEPDCIVFDSQKPNIVYAGARSGLFVSKDEGISWEKIQDFNIFEPCSIAVNPSRTNEIYVCSFYNGIYKSEDYGKHFKKFDIQLNFLTNVAIATNNAGELFINDAGSILKLTKDGEVSQLGKGIFSGFGPRWKFIDGKIYIAVNTIKSDTLAVKITDKTIEFYKICDMLF